MKKKATYLLVVFSLLSAACSGGEADPADQPNEGSTVDVVTTTEVIAPVEPEDVNIAAGTFVLNVTYPFLNMPNTNELAYWEEAGYNVTVDAAGSSSDALIQLVAGNLDYAWIGTTVMLQAINQEGIPLVYLHDTVITDWGLSVPSDSPITEMADFAGTTIGVFSLGSSGIPLLNAFLQQNGVDPETEVELIPIGFGPQASEALNGGDVDAIMLWGSALAQLELLGHDFREFQDERWSTMSNIGLVTTREHFTENRQMALDIVRGMNQGLEFFEASPECTTQLQWANWPDTKPANMSDEDALAWELSLLERQMIGVKGVSAMSGSDWGIPTAVGVANMQDFLLEAGLLETSVDPASIVPDDAFSAEANDFDHDGVRQEADGCSF